MTAFDVSRTQLGLDPVVRSGSGRPRPAIKPTRFIVHYVGAGRFLDEGDSPREIRGIEDYASGAGKPNEYNSFSDSEGRTYEDAGPYRAAHCTGQNDQWGHCVLIGIETPTPAQLTKLIEGVRRARAQAIKEGLSPDHTVHTHAEMATNTTRTNCPGPVIRAPEVWAQIAAPLTNNPTANREDDDDMTPLATPRRAYDTRQIKQPLGAGETRKVPILNRPGRAFVHITTISEGTQGYVSISGTDQRSDTSLVNFDRDRIASDGAPITLPDGTLRITASNVCQVVVDVFAEG